VIHAIHSCLRDAMHYVYCTLRELKEFLKLLTIQVAVTKNFGE
jgi:hypothetical protein